VNWIIPWDVVQNKLPELRTNVEQVLQDEEGVNIADFGPLTTLQSRSDSR